MTGFTINIEDGATYNGRDITGELTALKPVRRGTRGWFVTVPGHEVGAGSATARVLLTDVAAARLQIQLEGKFAPVFDEDVEVEQEPEVPPEVALERMVETFEIMDEMIQGVTAGHVDGVVVFGPPGVGKSWNVMSALNEASLDQVLKDLPPRYTIHSGYMTTVHLFKSLWESREKGQVCVLDDLDSIFTEPESLNLLKAALDTTGERWLSYAADSRLLKDEEIANRFIYNGAVIFITNVDFEKSRGKIRDHLDAILSRCHYLDLTIDSQRDKFLWLKHVTMEQGMLRRKGLNEKQAMEIIDFIQENIDDMRELSLRMVLKLADLRKIKGKYDWRKKARVTCMKRGRKGSLGRVIHDNKLERLTPA